MPTTIRLEGGPYSGEMVVPGPMAPSIGIPVDEHIRPVPTANPFAVAMYELEQRANGNVYVFKRFQRPGNQQFPIHFVDGPAAGNLLAPQPAQYLDPEQRVYLSSDGMPYQGKGDPVSVAIYERREEGGRFFYILRAIDSSPETVRAAVEAVNEQRLTAAINRFYASPNDDIYSMKPTGEHAQVPIEVGHRRGNVDEKIAPLIAEVWRVGLDTIGSCQDRPAGSPHEGMAYIGFPRMQDARAFHSRVSEAGIPATFVENKFKVALRQSPDAPNEETFEFDAANVLFDPNDIDRIVEAFRTV